VHLVGKTGSVSEFGLWFSITLNILISRTQVYTVLDLSNEKLFIR